MAPAEEIDRAQRHGAELVDRPAPVARRQSWFPIVAALLVVTAAKQVVLALAYPPFQGHDEVAHLGYLRVLVDEDRLPRLWDRLPQVLSDHSRFTLDWPALYTANHPPLYYILAAPAYLLAGDSYLRQLYFVRLIAIPFLLATVWLTYRLAMLLFPNDAFLALTAPAVVAMQPQVGFEGAIVNNDILAIFFGALILFLMTRMILLGLTTRRAFGLGIACGLGLLTKATLTALLPVVAAVALWRLWPRPTRRIADVAWWRENLPAAVALAAPTLLLPLPWYLYLRSAYGDFTAFEATQELQRDWNRPAGSFGELLTSSAFHAERVKETWGFYGWKLLPLGRGELLVVYLTMIVVAVGLMVGLLKFAGEWRHGRRIDQDRALAVAALAAACLSMYGAMVYFGTMFMLTQARYFFPIVPAAALIAMLGVRALVPPQARMPAAAVVIASAAGFQVLLLTRLVLPYALA